MRIRLFSLTAVSVLLAAFLPAQRIETVRASTMAANADSIALIASWRASNVDSVRVAWAVGGYTVTRTVRGTVTADTTRVARSEAAQAATLTLTPIRRTITGAPRSASVVVPALDARPSIDDVRVDTAASLGVITKPIPADVLTPNLQGGLLPIVDSRFVGLTAGGPLVGGLTYVWDGRVITDPTGSAPLGTTVFETFYPGNSRGDGVGGAKVYGAEGHKWREIYFSMAVFFPANYVVHSNGEKFWYPLLDGQTASFFLNLHPLNDSPTGKTFGFNWVNRPGDVATGQTSGALIRKGEWQLVEVYMKISSPNAANGILRTWVNGLPAVDRSDVQYYAGSAQRYFDGIRFDGTRGGGASSVPTPPAGQSRYYNRLVFYASP